MSATTLTERLELPITGMTCASCANRIERKLNKLDGVTATVNYATETAYVEHADEIRVEQLIAAVEAAGYQAALPSAQADTDQPAEQDPAARLRNRLIISALLSVPVLLISMISGLQFDNWQWLSLQLATPVVLWAAWPFHRAAWANLKHATATMDTLISVGTLAAWHSHGQSRGKLNTARRGRADPVVHKPFPTERFSHESRRPQP
jgi:Cu+-exporting ATPase